MPEDRVAYKLIIETPDGEKFEFELRDETVEQLQAIARRNGVPLATAILTAIRNEDFLEEQVSEGGKLLVAKDNKLQELEFKALQPA